jgi:uncharacterized protein YjbI with pentapeptide repeats
LARQTVILLQEEILSFEPEEVSLKLDRPLTRADVESLLDQQASSEKLNLSGQNLAIINFAGLDLSGADFSQTHLNGANFLMATLVGVNLSEARLNGVKGHKARLDEANLEGASLIEAILDEASFHKAQLSNANLSGADLRKANLSGANLSGADLSEADLSGADLSNACLYQADLSRAILIETNLNEADLRGAILGGAKLDGARLDKSNLSQVRLVLVNLREAKMGQANLSEADLSWSDLSGANLALTDLSGAKLVETDLTGANLQGANLSGANFSGANLGDARLVGADLAGVNLSGANLSGAYLSEAQKTLLEPLGDVLGLAETRSAQALLELEGLAQPEEPPRSPNGLVAPAEEVALGLDQAGPTSAILEAAANLPLLAPDPDQPLPPDLLEPDLSFLVGGPELPDPAASDESLDHTDAAVPTLKLVVKEQPLSVHSLVKLLAALEELDSCFRLIERGRWADLVDFHRSPDRWRDRPAALTLKKLNSANGEIELTSGETENSATTLPALRDLLAGLGKVRKPARPKTGGLEIGPEGLEKAFNAARLLAEKVLQTFSSGLEPEVRAMAAQIMLANIIQLAEGPFIELPGGHPIRPGRPLKPPGWPSWVQDS